MNLDTRFDRTIFQTKISKTVVGRKTVCETESGGHTEWRTQLNSQATI